MEDYFTLLGLEPRFDLALPELEQRYFQLQRQHHPDRAPPAQRAQAQAQSIALNRAYNTLKQPLSRARHLLALHGAQEAAPGQAVLMQNMEWREALEEAATAAEINALQAQAAARRAQCMEELNAACAQKSWPIAAQHAMMLAYLEKLQEELQHKILTL